MIRKMLVVAAAIAMPVSVVAVSGVANASKPPPVDATHYTLVCTGITATAKFAPPLTTAGSAASNEKTSIKGSASGCTATPTAGGTPIAVTAAKISGVINSPASTHTCGALATPTSESGNLTAAWKTTPKIAQKNSVLAVSTVTGGIGANGNATFSISFAGGTGAFQGANGGASDSNDAMTTVPIATILGSCGGKGLKSINVTANTNAGHGPALSLS
jgi:hypothetical protein